MTMTAIQHTLASIALVMFPEDDKRVGISRMFFAQAVDEAGTVLQAADRRDHSPTITSNSPPSTRSSLPVRQPRALSRTSGEGSAR